MPKTTQSSHEVFHKVRANFSLLPYDVNQEPSRDYSEKLVQMNFFYLGCILGGCFPALNLDGQNRQSPIVSVQRAWSTLAGHSAIPRGTDDVRMSANRAIRIAARRVQGL